MLLRTKAQPGLPGKDDMQEKRLRIPENLSILNTEKAAPVRAVFLHLQAPGGCRRYDLSSSHICIVIICIPCFGGIYFFDSFFEMAESVFCKTS